METSVVCFGEILWDLLPAGEQPGGAPMNVAYHLQKLGVNSTLISRVGNDDYGRRLLAYVQEQGLKVDKVQVDDTRRTGIVYALPNERHEVSYEIVQPVAWDYIAWDPSFVPLVQQAEFFVYGSLSARTDVSKDTLMRLLQLAGKRVCDINIRQPHFSRELAIALLQGVNLLKLNEHELPVLAEWIGKGGSFEEQLARVQHHFRIPTVVVTRGAGGAMLRTGEQLYTHHGFRVQVADTVGSGDAFLAGLLSRLQQGAAPEAALEFACATGALVATFSGACPAYDPAAIDALIRRGEKGGTV